MVPCNKVDASDIMDDPQVTMVYSEEYDSRKAQAEADEMTPEAEVATTTEDSYKTLRLQIMSSEDKAELRQIGAGLGVELAKTMRIPTMRNELLGRIDEIQETA
jgi:hypothetical protein